MANDTTMTTSLRPKKRPDDLVSNADRKKYQDMLDSAARSEESGVTKQKCGGSTRKMASGGKVKEGSAKDTREDKAQAKKRGISMDKWERSAADKKHDAEGMKCGGRTKKMAAGGSVRGTGAAIRGKNFSGEF